MALNIQQVSHLTKADAVYAEVRRLILEGVLPPTTQLNQEALAEELNVSTTPLREALRRLGAEGLVRTSAHREVVVSSLNSRDLVALYEIRENLDALAAAFAAERHTEEDRASLLQAREWLIAPQPESADVVAHNRRLHRTIYSVCHNAQLIDLLDDLWDKCDRYRRLVDHARLKALFDSAQAEEHLEILNAVLDRDAPRAQLLMQAHVHRTRDDIERIAEDEKLEGW